MILPRQQLTSGKGAYNTLLFISEGHMSKMLLGRSEAKTHKFGRRSNAVPSSIHGNDL